MTDSLKSNDIQKGSVSQNYSSDQVNKIYIPAGRGIETKEIRIN